MNDQKQSQTVLPPPTDHVPLAVEKKRDLHPLIIISLGLVVVGVAVYLFDRFALLFQQLLMAVFIFFLIFPIHRWLVRNRVPAFFSYILLAVLLLGIFGIASFWIYDSLTDFAQNVELYEERAGKLVDQVAQQLPGVNAVQFRAFLRDTGTVERLVELAQLMFGTILGLFGYLSMVLVFLILVLIDQNSLKHRIERGFNKEHSRDILEGGKEISTSIGRYIQVVTFCNLLVGTFTAIVLYLFGVDGAFFWGFLGFLLPYILYIGPILAATLPGLFAIIVLDNPLNGLLVLAILHAGHFAFGTVLQPVLVGGRLHLSPLLILISLVFWGSLWGIPGMILAAPLLMTTKVILENFSGTKPLAALMGKNQKDEERKKVKGKR